MSHYSSIQYNSWGPRLVRAFPSGSDILHCLRCRDPGSISGSGRSPRMRMAIHSSILAWRIPCREEPGELQFIGSQRVGQDWTNSFELFVLRLSLVAQLCSTLCNPLGHSTKGFPVHHQLLELAQTHIHWLGDAIQLSYLLSSSSFLP